MMAALLNDNGLRVAAYGAAALLALAAARRTAHGSHRRDRVEPAFWVLTALLLAALALSREINLASQIAGVGRDIFRTEGWYRDRRPVQEFAVLVALAGASLAGLAGTWVLLARRRTQIVPGFAALLCLATFLVVRAVSLHSIDAVLYRRSILAVQINALAELAAVLLIGLAAVFAMASRASATE